MSVILFGPKVNWNFGFFLIISVHFQQSAPLVINSRCCGDISNNNNNYIYTLHFPCAFSLYCKRKKMQITEDITVIKQKKRSSKDNKVVYAKKTIKECALKHLAGGERPTKEPLVKPALFTTVPSLIIHGHP